MPAHDPFAAEVKKIVGSERFLADRESCLCYAYDATGLSYPPQWVIFPESTEEIARIMALANRYQVPIIPRGAGTGMTGGSLAVKGGALLALARLNRILEIDADNMTAVVEPGVVTADLQAEVEKRELFYPPDPASLDSSTLGGNVAEGAGGPRAVKYGVTRDYVMALEVVLPTGEIVHTGAATLKSVAGYDLTRLLVGSEGTLAIITKIRLRLLALPPARLTVLAAFKDTVDAAATVTAILHRRIVPAALEFMDAQSIAVVRDFLGDEVPADAQALLLVELDGFPAAIESELTELKAALNRPSIISIREARTPAERDQAWKARRSISPALKKERLKKINQDVVVPRTRIAELVAQVRTMAERYSLRIINFGHAGDGNIHVNIMIDPDDEAALARAKEAVRELFSLVVAMKGSISGEHGIGLTKAPYLGLEVDAPSLEAMRRIKRALDPNDILNPGKIFLPVEK